MEFRCRLGTTSGEIIEGIYVAQSVFNQELATLLKAGMPLVQSLDILRARMTSPVFKSVLDDVYEKVRSGTALSDAFDAHNDLFPSVYIASLMAGERSGNLDAVLRRFVAYSKTIDTVRSKTISAMMYPVILVALAVILVGIIVIKVVPTFADFYGSFDADLPLSTRVIVAVSDAIRAEFWVILLAIAGGAAAFVTWVKAPGRAAQFDRLVLRVPVIGHSFHKFSTSQLARTLATLLSGGIPLVNALEIAARSTGSTASPTSTTKRSRRKSRAS